MAGERALTWELALGKDVAAQSGTALVAE